MPELMKGLGVDLLGRAVMRWQQFERRGMHDLTYGTAKRKAISIAKPVGIAALATAALFGLNKLIKRKKGG
jgi:hypothetical protein